MLQPVDLCDGMEVEARFSRSVNPDDGKAIWSAWQVVTIFVRRRDQPLKKQRHKRKFHEVGAIIELAIHNRGWASYVEDDFCNGEWLNEDYRMELRPV